jgi:hypothetical protein
MCGIKEDGKEREAETTLIGEASTFEIDPGQGTNVLQMDVWESGVWI